jgi:hypothetical protein
MKPRISRAQLRRLRLREGDIILVRDEETLHALAATKMPKGFPCCEIVIAPGSVHRLSVDYLRKLLERAQHEAKMSPVQETL